MSANRDNDFDALQRRITELESALRVASHDLRSPLMTIQGFSQELSDFTAELKQLLPQLPTTGDDDRFRAILLAEIPEAVQFIREGATKLEALINNLAKNL
jgi:signal transduction histidine kinase